MVFYQRLKAFPCKTTVLVLTAPAGVEGQFPVSEVPLQTTHPRRHHRPGASGTPRLHRLRRHGLVQDQPTQRGKGLGTAYQPAPLQVCCSRDSKYLLFNILTTNTFHPCTHPHSELFNQNFIFHPKEF